MKYVSIKVFEPTKKKLKIRAVKESKTFDQLLSELSDKK